MNETGYDLRKFDKIPKAHQKILLTEIIKSAEKHCHRKIDLNDTDQDIFYFIITSIQEYAIKFFYSTKKWITCKNIKTYL